MKRHEWIRCNSFLTSLVVHAAVLILMGAFALGTALDGEGHVLALFSRSDADAQELLDETSLAFRALAASAPGASESATVPDQPLAMPRVRRPLDIAPSQPAQPERAELDFGELLEIPLRPGGTAAKESGGVPNVSNRPFGVRNAFAAQRAAALVIRRELGTGLDTLQRMPKDRVWVVRGTYDEIHKVLELYEIPYQFLGQTPAKDINPNSLLCVNCGATVKDGYALRRFVTAGGWLITSDWAVGNLVATFPDVVRLLGSQNPDTTVQVAAHRTTDNAELLRGVPSGGRWWLEHNSFFPAVDPRQAKVFITSAEMKQRFGTPVVAFEFRPGQGRVLHLVGHFYQKQGTARGLVAMHRLILNIMLEREKERQRRERPLASARPPVEKKQAAEPPPDQPGERVPSGPR